MVTAKERDRLLELLQEPRTMKELAKLTKMKYHTVRNKVVELIEEGSIETLLYFKDREKLYQAVGVGSENGLFISYKGKPVTYREAAQVLRDLVVKLHHFRYGLCNVAYRSYELAERGEYGGGLTPAQTKAELMPILKEMQSAMLIIEQALKDKRIWAADPELYIKMGFPVDRLMDAVLEFEKVAIPGE